MEAKFPRSIYGHSPLGTFYQPEFERTLLRGLARFGNVSVAFAHAVGALAQDEHGVTLTISAPGGIRRVRAAYVVACDGGTSGVREGLGVKLVGSTYTERWLVVDAIVPNHSVKGITFRCDPRRPTVELPAVGDRVRWEFMQLPGESEEKLSRDETVRALVKEKAGVNAFEIERKAVYAFHARVADRWRVGRVFLAGDAAHLMPPFAGQGMNGGMKDAANLSWKLVAVLNGQASEEILDTYQVERAPVVTTGWLRSPAGLGRSSCRRTGRSPPLATRFSPASISRAASAPLSAEGASFRRPPFIAAPSQRAGETR